MDVAMVTSGFEKPPWIFKGSAVYQIHSVRVDSVRPFIPKEFKVVQNFGYTMGGFFLANYEESPFGAFDELVIIAAIVKPDRSSRAWAAKVLVNSDEARDHGRKVFGLPSQVANFITYNSGTRCMLKQKSKVISPQSKAEGLFNINGLGFSKLPKNYKDTQIREIKEQGATNSWNLNIKTKAPNLELNRFNINPRIKLSLTSLSGLTEYNPHLLEYTCQIETRVRVIGTSKISEQFAPSNEECEFSKHQNSSADMKNLMIETLENSKPLIAVEFNSMKMTVDSPTMVSKC
ncbi:hypothetical protein ABFS82_11G078600 [Erythranthe guttata]|uniref:Acetoacetate decarboxylase n=2 Tax=Erythranthe guttata TaxID=4155 RepID=A0A022QMH6_ERYGU|nr:PREDICTED: uncharacterized protein LOC105967984 isoform X1 [Erythranthe guttata]EYU28453.1 hypothetical protein MIMGU_mgv1a011219mg [Erythranthe guttata]|eukprot:XP_012848023.1 PREDICTED: uncharacterized protein LOC105967984 isoform X1 [Erythranthe guttata]